MDFWRSHSERLQALESSTSFDSRLILIAGFSFAQVSFAVRVFLQLCLSFFCCGQLEPEGCCISVFANPMGVKFGDTEEGFHFVGSCINEQTERPAELAGQPIEATMMDSDATGVPASDPISQFQTVLSDPISQFLTPVAPDTNVDGTLTVMTMLPLLVAMMRVCCLGVVFLSPSTDST